MKAPLPASALCPTCGTTFRPGRPSGVVQRYCRRLCNPKYGWSCTVCGTVRDAGGRGRAQTPDDKYICHPCRRERNQALAVPVREDCMLCAKPLSEKQCAAGNQFCGSRCSFRFQTILNQPSRKHKRLRRHGALRPFDEAAGAWLQGPCRRQKLSVHIYDDNSVSIGCPWCCLHLPINDDNCSAECEGCAAIVSLEKPFVV